MADGMKPQYDVIGTTYRQTRQADARITAHLISLFKLPPGAVIADIGAGIGSYSNALAEAGFSVRAVEPSSVMRKQAAPHSGVEWYQGYAEALPIADNSVDGIICTLALHHFTEMQASVREMCRITGDGPIVLLTFDPRLGENFWLYDYFPVFMTDAQRVFPPIEEITSLFTGSREGETVVVPFLLPADLSDAFCAACWRNPERYLDPVVQAGISSFALADSESVQKGLSALQQDLANGQWRKRYGDILALSEFDAGYRFVVVRSKG